MFCPDVWLLMGSYLSTQDLGWEISERVIETKDKAFIESEEVINANEFTSEGRESKNPIELLRLIQNHYS